MEIGDGSSDARAEDEADGVKRDGKECDVSACLTELFHNSW